MHDNCEYDICVACSGGGKGGVQKEACGGGAVPEECTSLCSTSCSTYGEGELARVWLQTTDGAKDIPLRHRPRPDSHLTTAWLTQFRGTVPDGWPQLSTKDGGDNGDSIATAVLKCIIEADLWEALRLGGKPGDHNKYIFNGDFVDRGDDGCEVVLVLCALCLMYPSAVFLSRGNHETWEI
eukprot:gene2862-2767_t